MSASTPLNLAEALRETETRFQNMANQSPVMLWMSGTEGLCTFFNQTWLDFTGNTLEEEWGVGWSEGVHPEDFQNCMDSYIAAFNERKKFEIEYRLLRHDGMYRWILDRGVPRFTPNGAFTGFIGSCADIHEKKQLELDLKNAVQARDDFLSIASHELKTPLSVLGLQLNLLARMVSAEGEWAEIRECLQKLNHSAMKEIGRLSNLIEGLLSVATINSGKVLLERKKVDLGALVRENMERLTDVAAHAGCSIQIQVLGDEIVIGEWDPHKLDQVVTNLLTNSLKYAAGKPLEISISSDGNQAILKAKDHGPGIPKEQHELIFEKFQRGATQQSVGGLGLGLYISKTIVEQHGGKIWIESEAGKGATFVVSLPK